MDSRQASYWTRRRASVKESDLGALHSRLSAIRKQRAGDGSFGRDAAIVWERISSGYRVADLQLDRFMQALHFLHHCQTEPTFKAVGLFHDAVSMKSLMNSLFEKMENMMSLVAVQEDSGDLVGVLIASFFHKSDLQVTKEKGETLCQVMSLRCRAIAEADFYESLDAERCVYVDVVCVRPDHRARGIGTALLRSCVARATDCSACVGEFTSNAGQTIAGRLRFKLLTELPYGRLEREDNRLRVFRSCHPEDYSVACMALEILPSAFRTIPVDIAEEDQTDGEQTKPPEKRRRANRRR